MNKETDISTRHNLTIMSDIIDVLKRQFIIEENKYEIERLKREVGMLSDYCKVSRNGQVLIVAKQLSDKQKASLAILARYLGHKLEQVIPERLRIEEISNSTEGVDRAKTEKCVHELIKLGFVGESEDETYVANPDRTQDLIDSFRKL